MERLAPGPSQVGQRGRLGGWGMLFSEGPGMIIDFTCSQRALRQLLVMTGVFVFSIKKIAFICSVCVARTIVPAMVLVWGSEKKK